MNKNKELVKNTIILFIGKFCTQFMSLLLLPLYTRCLTTSDYGITDLIQTYLTLFVPIILLRIDTAVFRFLIDSRKDEKQKTTIITNATISIVIQIVVCVLIYIIIGMFVQIQYFWLIMLNALALSLSNIMLEVSRGMGNHKYYSIASIISGVVIIGLNVIFLIPLHLGVAGVLIANIIANIICFIYLVYINKVIKYIKPANRSKNKIKELLYYSIPMVPNELSWWIVHVSDRTIISIAINTAANGIYSVSCKFSNILSSIFSIFNMSWHESASIHINDEDRDVFFSSIIKEAFNFFVSVCVVIIAVMPFIFKIIIDSAYNEAYQYIPLLLLGNIFNVLVGLFGGIYVAKKLTKEVAKTTILAAIINISVNIILVKFIGIYAAVISTVIAYALMAIYRYIDVQRFVKIKISIKTIIQTAVAFGFTSVLYFYNTIWGNILNIIIAIVYSIIVNRKVLSVGMRILRRK